jgi:Tol biopolymer transport system component
MTTSRRISALALLCALGGGACGRVAFDDTSPAFENFDAGGPRDAGRTPLYDDAGRLIDTNVPVPTEETLPGPATGVSTGAMSGGASNGASGASVDADLSETGSLVAFSSAATNLVAGDTNGHVDVFVYDVATQTTERIALAAAQPNGPSGALATGVPTGTGQELDAEVATGPALSAAGDRVAFSSLASNWVTADTNGVLDIIVFDRTGDSAVRASVGVLDAQANGASWSPSLSSDGSVVAFASAATNLAPDDFGGHVDVFMRDLTANETTVVSRRADGASFDGPSSQPSISGDGERIAFVTEATNVLSGRLLPAVPKVVVRERSDGSMRVVSLAAGGFLADRSASFPVISADGRFVAFVTSATNIGPDSNAILDVYRHDLATGDTVCISIGRDGRAASAFRTRPDMSGDGRFVLFGSLSSAIVQNDYNGAGDAFVRDTLLETTRAASVTPELRIANGISVPRAISQDGSTVAFSSVASDVATGDTNRVSDVFVIGNPITP